jgi:site-specific recombinase XerD
LKEKRDRALLAVLLACGLRRHEAVELNSGHIQQREEHWDIIDLKGKAGHIRTILMPAWVKNVLDQWLQATVRSLDEIPNTEGSGPQPVGSSGSPTNVRPIT